MIPGPIRSAVKSHHHTTLIPNPFGFWLLGLSDDAQAAALGEQSKGTVTQQEVGASDDNYQTAIKDPRCHKGRTGL